MKLDLETWAQIIRERCAQAGIEPFALPDVQNHRPSEVFDLIDARIAQETTHGIADPDRQDDPRADRG